MEPNKRKDWDHYFMDIAVVVSSRSNCSRPAKGAVIVRDRRIISTGYNGTPMGTKNCNEGGCARCAATTDKTSGSNLTECTCCHAEENSIVQAAKNGISTDGATIYSTFLPCFWCTKMIINSGIKRVVTLENYPTDVSLELLKQAGVIQEQLQ